MRSVPFPEPVDDEEDLAPTRVPEAPVTAAGKSPEICFMDGVAGALRAPQVPVEIRIQDDVPPGSGGVDEAERTVLAGSIAPAQRKVGASVEFEELGRGALGRVFVSIDMGLQREIAIKEILPERLNGSPAEAQALRARFLREARVTGQLEHPNIVPIYEVGERDDGRLYYSMKRIRGKTLRQAIHDAGSLAARLALLNHFLGLCHAIAYAHSRGVIHRDVKPQNVMLGEFGETVVLDWGTAKLASDRVESVSKPPAIREPAEDRPEETAQGHLVGTPAYMAPEQLKGRVDQVDARSDVWSLGVVLYLLLAGRLPFRGTLRELVADGAESEVEPLLGIDASIPAELSAIAERALQRDPEARYQTAGEMAKDVEAYLTGAKVGAYEYTLPDLLKRFWHEHRTTLLVGVAGLALALGLSVDAYRRVVAARDAALRAEQLQRVSARKAKESLAQLLAKRAVAALARYDSITADLLASQSLSIAPSAETRGIVLSVSRSLQPRFVATEDLDTYCSHLAHSKETGVSACASGKKVEAVSHGRLFEVARHEAQVSAVALTPNGERLVSADQTGEIQLTDVRESAVPTLRSRASGAVTTLAFDAVGDRLLVGFADGRVELRDAAALEVLETRRLNEPVSSLAMSSSGALAAGGRLGALQLWIRTDEHGVALADEHGVALAGHHGTLTALAFSPSGAVLASGSADQSVRLWSISHPSQYPAIIATNRVAKDFAWSNSERQLIYGTRDHRVVWYDRKAERNIAELPGHRDSVSSVTLSPDERTLVSIDQRFQRRSWQLPDLLWPHRLVDRGNVLALTWFSGRKGLISAGLGRAGVCLWDLQRTECETRLPVSANEVRALAVSDNGKFLAVGATGGELLVWDLQTRLPLTPLFGHDADVRAVLFSAGDRELLSADLDGRLTRWQAAGGRQLAERRFAHGINALSASPSQRRVAVATRGGTVSVWDARLSREQVRLKASSDWVMDVAFVGETKLVSAGADGILRLWDLERKKELARLGAARGRLLSVDVSSDHRWLAAAGEDKVVRIWDLRRQQLVAILREHDAPVRRVQFSPRSTWLASGSDDARVRLWDLSALDTPPEELLKDAVNRYGMSPEQLASLDLGLAE